MRTITVIIVSFLLTFRLSGQDSEGTISLDGYVTNMQSVMFSDADEDWVIDNLIHNRLNFRWYPSDRKSEANL